MTCHLIILNFNFITIIFMLHQEKWFLANGYRLNKHYWLINDLLERCYCQPLKCGGSKPPSQLSDFPTKRKLV